MRIVGQSYRFYDGASSECPARALDFKVLDQGHLVSVCEEIADSITYLDAFGGSAALRELGGRHLLTRLVVKKIVIIAHGVSADIEGTSARRQIALEEPRPESQHAANARSGEQRAGIQAKPASRTRDPPDGKGEPVGRV